MWTAAAVWAVVGCVAGVGLAQKATTSVPAKAKDSPAVLLEKGIYTEETVGDLDAAIKVYRQIIDDAKANRPYAAQAQYRLAMCYLKKGDKAKAAAELRQLLASYPQEKDIAAQAQKELAKLSPPLRGTAAFGPVIEKTLNDLDDGRGHEGLDLQSGRQFDVPKKREWSKAQRHQWIMANGIDLFVDYASSEGGRWALIVFNLKLEAVHQRWDDISPEYLQTVTASGNSKTEMIERGGYKIYPIQDKGKPPLTFAVKTAKGELGVLQIVEFVGKPKSVKIRYKLLEYGAAPAADAAPRAKRTNPAAFANDVDPSLDKITVTFDRPMMDKSWSWTGGGETFPKIQTPSYDAARTTCTLPVKLQPGKVYWVGVNSPSHRNFKAADGTTAARYVILFATKAADGKPTPLPEDMVKQAKAINDQATRAATSAVAKEAENLVAEGRRLWNARKLPEAEAKFKAAVAKDPTNANAFNGLGWAQQNQGKILNATDAFDKALAIDPKLPGALNGLGWIAKSQGKTDQAIEYWRKAVAANPRTTAALSGLATTFAELGQYDKAVEVYRQWLKADPKSAPASAGLKKAQDANRASKEAVSAAEKWLKLVDDGKYGASWDAASSLLRKAVTKDAFAKQIQAARKPLGKAQSRKIMSATFRAAMPGAPDGQYVVIQFEAVFENKKQAVETITPMKCEDGKWRVSGYYIK